MRAIIQAFQPWAAPIAILGAAVILGAAILATHQRYAISTIPRPEGVYDAWRVDTVTGELQLCSLEPNVFNQFGGKPQYVIACHRSIGGDAIVPGKKP
jgi:hypothetical protein